MGVLYIQDKYSFMTFYFIIVMEIPTHKGTNSYKLKEAKLPNIICQLTTKDTFVCFLALVNLLLTIDIHIFERTKARKYSQLLLIRIIVKRLSHCLTNQRIKHRDSKLQINLTCLSCLARSSWESFLLLLFTFVF